MIICGDSFDKINPTSKELDCFSIFLKKINLPTILLAANSHESTTQTESIVNHFGILKDTITTVKEYHDENKLFVGHFILNQSSKNYGGTVDSQTLKQFRFIVLGHGHNFETKNNWCQLGSIRRVDFRDNPDSPNKVGICLDYESDRPRWLWLTLNSPYPMINIELGKEMSNLPQNDPFKTLSTEEGKDTEKGESSISQAQDSSKTRQNKALSDLLTKLDNLPAKTKVRIVFKDYNLWREFLPLSETYKQKFSKFVEKKDFLISANTKILQSKETSSLKDSLIKFLETNKVPEDIKKVLLEELK